jgi:hypothetical protein
MRRMTQDDGAVAVLVALLSVVLFGFAALVIDVAVLYHERRQLQNGADAAALSVAHGCAAGGCTDAVAAAQGFVTDNHDAVSAPGTPGRGKLVTLCGFGELEGLALPLAVCTDEADRATNYPGNYVVARVASGTQEGAAGLAPILAGILPGDQLPTTVPARAVVRWGTAGSLATRLPVTMSRCRWNLITALGTKLSPAPPPQSTWVEGSYPKDDATRLLEAQQSLITHTAGTEPEDECTALELEAPGNFNWLATDGTCEATAVDGSDTTFDNDTGADVPADCQSELKKLVGTVVGVPIYTSPPENGSVGEYETDGFAAFFVTGLYLNGGPDVKVKSIIASATSAAPCNAPTFCISGLFVEAAADGEIVSGGTDYGLQVVQMAY